MMFCLSLICSRYSSPPGSQARASLYWRMAGWMDGLVSTWFFSAYFSKTTLYMTLIVSMPPRRRFKTPFVKKSEFLKNLNFLKKFRTKRVFFEKIHQKEFLFFWLKRIPIFLIKKNSYFFWLKRIPNFLD